MDTPAIGSSSAAPLPRERSPWPLLSEPLPDVSAQFAACHLDR